MNSFNFTGRVVSFGFARLQNGKFSPIKSGQQGLRQTSRGKHFIRFTVAIDRKQRDQNGNHIADFAKMSAWGKTADYMGIMNSGDLVAGSASFRTNHFQGRDGKTHYSEGFVIDPDKISRMNMSKVSQQQYQQHKQSMQNNNQNSNNMFGNNQMNNGSQMNNSSMNMTNNQPHNMNQNNNGNRMMGNNMNQNMNNNRMMNNGNNQSQNQFNQPNNNGNQNAPINGNSNKTGDNGLPF